MMREAMNDPLARLEDRATYVRQQVLSVNSMVPKPGREEQSQEDTCLKPHNIWHGPGPG